MDQVTADVLCQTDGWNFQILCYHLAILWRNFCVVRCCGSYDLRYFCQYKIVDGPEPQMIEADLGDHL